MTDLDAIRECERDGLQAILLPGQIADEDVRWGVTKKGVGHGCGRTLAAALGAFRRDAVSRTEPTTAAVAKIAALRRDGA